MKAFKSRERFLHNRDSYYVNRSSRKQGRAPYSITTIQDHNNTELQQLRSYRNSNTLKVDLLSLCNQII